MQISLEPYLSDEQCSTHLKSSERSLHTKHPLAVSSTQSPMHKSWHCFLSVVNEGDCSKRWHVFLFQQYPVFGHFLHWSSQLVIFFPITIFPNWIILSQSIWWWWWWWWCSEQIKLICETNKFFVSRPRSQLSGFKKNLSLIKLLLWCRDGVKLKIYLRKTKSVIITINSNWTPTYSKEIWKTNLRVVKICDKNHVFLRCPIILPLLNSSRIWRKHSW